MLQAAIAQHKSPLKLIASIFKALISEGLPGISWRLKRYITGAGKSDIHEFDAQSRGPNNTKNLKEKLSIPYTKGHTILFIGHDGHHAGAQVILLSLIRWLRQNTGIDAKIILLETGVLYSKFLNLYPTIVWRELIHTCPNQIKRKEFLQNWIGPARIIYGNTMLAPSIYDELSFLEAKYITHIHELETSFRLYSKKDVLQKMTDFTDHYIGCSQQVSDFLSKEFTIAKNNISTIYEFIDIPANDQKKEKRDVRNNLGIGENTFVILCCGTIYWRKGPDIAVNTAIELKSRLKKDWLLIWVGLNHWDDDIHSKSRHSWAHVQETINENRLNKNILFTGPIDDVTDYYRASDVFFLPSREDPFPLVCLEAGYHRLPVICFENAGGMPDFVGTDCGFVVSYENEVQAAEKITELAEDAELRFEMGENAMYKVARFHSTSLAGEKIFGLLSEIAALPPTVSVIVPCYNHGRFLRDRLQSIFNQTYVNIEVWLLDDCSTDDSESILKEYVAHPNVHILRNEMNSGNPFAQWKKGISLANGELIWIAEGDDLCEPDFLQSLLPFFNDPSVVLAFSDSAIIDEKGVILGDYEDYYKRLASSLWNQSFLEFSSTVVNSGLGIKNTIPNASAVLFRKNAVSKDLLAKLPDFSFAGDWYFYVHICRNKRIGFLNKKLNRHRKHSQSVTTAFHADKTQTLLKETEEVHRYIIQNYRLNNMFIPRWEQYISDQIRVFYPDMPLKKYSNVYDFEGLNRSIQENIQYNELNRSLLFITTNNYSPEGGSEKLWKAAAVRARLEGYRVIVSIHRFSPSPPFISTLTKKGIEFIYQDGDFKSHISTIRPDLAVISLGDQDEGLAFYDLLYKEAVPYVIVNHLTKEPKYWPVKSHLIPAVSKGYLRANHIFFTSRNNKELMEKRLGHSLDNTDFFYNPFDVERQKSIPYPHDNTTFHLAMPASLQLQHKGQHLAVEVFALEKWRNRNIHLHLYGAGPDKDKIAKLIKKYKLIQVTLEGFTNDISQVWADCHALFLSSLMEGMPITLVGAMLAGRTAIVTDVGGNSEVLRDNISGFIAKEPTTEALDEALERAWVRRMEWQVIGMEARETILRTFPKDPVDDFLRKIRPFSAP